MNLNYRTG